LNARRAVGQLDITTFTPVVEVERPPRDASRIVGEDGLLILPARAAST
jgi:hypothetical protein